jgi:hypothetical protein
MRPSGGVTVSMLPSEWGDVLRGLKVLLGQPGISDGRKAEITALGLNIRRQVDECRVAGDPLDARRRDYDYEPKCATCSDAGLSGFELDDKGRPFAIPCPDCSRAKESA